MKRYIHTIFLSLAVMLTACDYNERNFPGLDELSRPENILRADRTITEADIPAVIAALNASGDPQASAWAAALSRDKAFSDDAPAAGIIPYYLKSLYYAVDAGSSVNVTYDNREAGDAAAGALAGEPYIVNSADYRAVWGDPYVESFTPDKSAAQHLPAILAAAIAEPAEGMYVNVEYYVSDEEPVPANVDQTVMEEDFEDYETVNEATTRNGWTQYQESGTYTYQAKTFNGNWYTQISNGSSGSRITWFISPETDLAGLADPRLTFDAKVGYYTSTCLEIKIGTGYDGSDPTAVTWTDISASFTLPTAPASGYGDDFENAGSASLAAFAGQKVFVAFRYNGDASATPARTTTYQLDNIRVYETIPGIAVENKSLRYAAWSYDEEATKWKAASADVLSLQPEDYAAMGVTYLSREQAPNYIPVWLAMKYPYAQSGDSYTVVFKTAAQATAAGKYLFAEGRWTAEPATVSKTDQFILSTAGWMFDPTFVLTLDKSDYEVVYQYVVRTHAATNPDLLNTSRKGEFYYGFVAQYPNVTYRDSDRRKDPAYPAEGTAADKAAFMNARTVEGLGVFMAEAMPQLQPEVNGVEQLAKLSIIIYSDPLSDRQNVTWTYTLRCTAPGVWEFVQREADDGTIETAP